ncbi:DapF: diaminopimelate epimerase [Rubrobacter radiotolerans]|uniref:Diaminopimelate epimerase n=1 Tax=Rubrobacter radiotolerans TaxID=42256 RepID=A0A023X7A4_RUBRA|nr:diaminopimelate epimerase [Rubrobacter radiotolerans]AHY47944.1 DapF: diaminopimelate epimerase [Rubrobacter radiotolerans]MDX5892582.1 diaminopimelate epimerase [Rubrobacter radiotolerans]SMC07871.1 diaminopimelate epimerase [Rubrobacter radiotolerans DSM 5868]
MHFTKMHGCGNDFVVLNASEVEGADLPALARRLCDRRFGVGGDGLLVPAPSEVADLRMVYLNSDGSSAEMCGNGLRCLARYARDRGLVGPDELTVETGAGVKRVWLRPDGSSRVEMGPPEVGEAVSLHGYTFLRVSMGNPHAVAFLPSREAVEELDLAGVGPLVERDAAFPEGTNVEFAFGDGGEGIRMRIWERGAGETLASGSGSCASAVAAISLGRARSPVSVALDGGSVLVEWDGGGTPVYMSGPAEYVFEGRLTGSSVRA